MAEARDLDRREPVTMLDLVDADADGQPSREVGGADCDDADSSVGTGFSETPYDGVDQDCSGSDLVDVDRDGHDAVVAGGDDCADERADVFPGADDHPYDGVDQDCSGADLVDADGDGFEGEQAGGGDCRDHDPAVHPGQTEHVDGVDEDCDERIDELEAPAGCAHVDPSGLGGTLVLVLAMGLRRRQA